MYPAPVEPLGTIVGLLALATLPSPPADRVLERSTSEVLHLPTRELELVTRRFTLHGLPLRGAYERIEHSPGGAPRITSARLDTVPAQHQPGDATVTPEAALAIVRAELGAVPRGAPSLVYLLVLGRPVLAWELELALSLTPEPSLRTVWISATTGRWLGEHEAAWHSRARVFPHNPSTTPEPVEVELTTLDATEPGLPLDSPGIEVRGCAAEAEGEPPAWWHEGACLPRARALSDADGNWYPPLPNVGLVDDNRALDDAYAEVAAYHYVERFFDVMRERGLTTRRCERFTVLVNRHDLDEDQQPVPVGGASYVDTCNADVSPTLLVGQSKDADYAYDADVLYHELGHSVIQQLAPSGLSERRLAPWGIVGEAGSINEGLADYFAMSVSGDPLLGEYVGRFEVVNGTPYLRTGETTAVCPYDLTGEWHSDGRVVAGAMWTVRARLGPVTDEIVLRALPRLGPDAVLDDFGVAALEVAHEMFEEGTLDDFGLALVERSLGARGLLGCDHVIDDPDLATNGKKMAMVAADARATPFAPGPFQLRVRVPDDATEVTLFATVTPNGEVEPSASFLVKRADEPIAFTYAVGEEVIEVAGDHDVELPAEALNDHDMIARLSVEPGEVLHVALANRTPTKATASNFFVAPSTPTPVEEDYDDGCGCRSHGPPRGWALLVLLLGSLRRRGRR